MDSATKWSSLRSAAIPPRSRCSATGGRGKPISLVVEALQAAGATTADGGRPAELLPHDPITRDALTDLALAPTVPTAEILLDQARVLLRDELMRPRSIHCGHP